MKIMYRVGYYESEAGWGSDYWETDYLTEEEARKAFKSCEDKYMGKSTTPSYYIRPNYIGKVVVQ